MKTIYSKTHRAIVNLEGILDIFPLEKRVIKEISFQDNEVCYIQHTESAGEPLLQELLSIMNELPVLRAAHAGNNMYHIDQESGPERLKAYVSNNEIIRVLSNYKFKKKDIIRMLKECRKKEHRRLARVG